MMKKRFMAGLLVICMILTMLPQSVFVSGFPFTDVSSDMWYYSSVEYAYENNLMSGLTSSQFGPNETLTRGMFVTILGRMDGVKKGDYASGSFTDVREGEYYAPYVEWAVENGITSGYGQGKFAPNDSVTREQMATFIARYTDAKGLTLPDGDNIVSGFGDDAAVSKFAKAGLELMRRTGLIKGYDDGNFYPQNNATRAEAAVANAEPAAADAQAGSEDSDITIDETFYKCYSLNQIHTNNIIRGNKESQGVNCFLRFIMRKNKKETHF